MKLLKFALFGAVLWTASMACMAQESTAKDGAWLKEGVDAFNRIAGATEPREADIERSEILLAYLDGVLSVHRQNNIMASIVVYFSQSGGEDAPLDEKAKVALAFAPLLRVPNEMPERQAVAVLQEYLDTNPGKWSDSANVVITQAFEEAFAP